MVDLFIGYRISAYDDVGLDNVISAVLPFYAVSGL